LPTILPTFIGIAFICCYSFDHNAHITFVDFRCSFLISANTPATNSQGLLVFFRFVFDSVRSLPKLFFFSPILNQIDSLSIVSRFYCNLVFDLDVLSWQNDSKAAKFEKFFFYRSLVEFVFIFFLLLIATLLNNMIPRTMSGRMDDDDDDDDEESSSIEYRPDRRLSIGTSNSNSGGINSSNRPNRNNFVSPVPTSSAHTMADLHDTAAVAAELAALSAASQPSFQRQQQQQQQQPHQQPPVRSTTSNAAAAAVVAKVEPFHSMNVEDLLQYFENRMNFPSKFCGA
jgi:hypothetical protein